MRAEIDEVPDRRTTEYSRISLRVANNILIQSHLTATYNSLFHRPNWESLGNHIWNARVSPLLQISQFRYLTGVLISVFVTDVHIPRRPIHF